MNFLFILPKILVLKLIRGYQKIFSPDHGLFKNRFPYGFCRFNPTCSDYAYQAIFKYGIIKGGLLTAWRLLRCNPWNKGGNDPLL
jgi:hypothetical protein